MELTHSEKSALSYALYAWRDLLWARCLADRRCEFWLWSGILSRHWEVTR